MERKIDRKIKSKVRTSKFKNSISIIPWRPHPKQVTFQFYTRNWTMHFDIPQMEWNALLNFFKMTKNKSNLSRGNIGFSNYDIRRGEIVFYNPKRELKMIEHLRNKDPMQWAKIKKNIEEIAKDVRKTGLRSRIFLSYDYFFSFAFDRESFIKFRNGCLSLKNFIKGKKFPGASINFT